MNSQKSDKKLIRSNDNSPLKISSEFTEKLKCLNNHHINIINTSRK